MRQNLTVAEYELTPERRTLSHHTEITGEAENKAKNMEKNKEKYKEKKGKCVNNKLTR